MKIVHYNGEDINQLLNQSLVILDFYADWCGPCKMLGLVLEDLASNSNIEGTIIKVNTDEYSDLAMKYGVMTIPNVFVYKDGKQINHFIGYKNIDEINELIK